MKVKIGNGLVPLNLLVLLLIVTITLIPSTSLRIALGLPFLLFPPGYALIAALFPKREGISAIERVVLSFGLSIAIVPLIGLILNYTPWGIRLEPVLYSIALFIFVTSIIAMLRRARLFEEERFSIEFQLKPPGWSGGAFDKFLSTILIVSILGALGALGYVIATPKVGETFTEFYILGPRGKAQGYPTEFVVEAGEVILVRYDDGEIQETSTGSVIVGIINHEHEEATYLISIKIDGEPLKVYFDGDKLEDVGPITLAHEEKWEHEVGFAPESVGNNQKLDFILYKDGVAYFEEPLHLRVDVRAQG